MNQCVQSIGSSGSYVTLNNKYRQEGPVTSMTSLCIFGSRAGLRPLMILSEDTTNNIYIYISSAFQGCGSGSMYIKINMDDLDPESNQVYTNL